MASPHASSFICLPFSSQDEVKHAYSVYYGVCLGSAAIGAPGALLFLFQVLCGEARKRISRSQRNILINLAIADLLADLGEHVKLCLQQLCDDTKCLHCETECIYAYI